MSDKLGGGGVLHMPDKLEGVRPILNKKCDVLCLQGGEGMGEF